METEQLFDRLLLLGTIHISPKSKRQVHEIILRECPAAVAVELDSARYRALMEHPTERNTLRDLLLSARHGTFSTSFITWLISFLEQGLGEQFGMHPGEEMLVAIQAAQKTGSEVFFIDQPLSITMQRIQSVGFEKQKLIIELVKGIFSKNDTQQSLLNLENDIKPSDMVQEILKAFRKQFPKIFKILIDERDAYIANQLISLLNRFPEKKICAVLGLGHLDGVKKRIHAHFSNRTTNRKT